MKQVTDFGEIPIEWNVDTILNVSSPVKRSIAMGPFGSNIKAENFVSSGVPVIRGTNMNFSRYVDGQFVYLTEEKADDLSGSNCLPDDLVFTHRGTIGQVALIPQGKFERYVISQSGMKLTVNKEIINPHFLFYFFKSEYGQYQILKYESQVGVPSISNPLTSLKEIQVPVPALPEQKAIADILSALDDKIDLLQRQNETLEKMAETLFRQWFIEEAKEDWEDGTLKDELDFTMGQSPSGASFNEEKIGTPMFQGNADFGFRFPSERVYTTEPKRFAYPLDTLISVRAPVGAQNMAKIECCIGRGVAAFRHKTNLNWYTYVYYKLNYLMDEIKKFNDEGTVFGSISKKDFEDIAITIPNDESIAQYELVAKPLNDKLINNCEHIQTLQNLRDILLPKLMSGEVRVKLD
ncbi:restriction endonuclease subunit S [Wohlfahrtiimonas chitiniclastica]|uniref:restriction endonuclease subunit S n=1 Tax=Wohlfahrtiimonas chitiniclastica TaxID=400946 RepID=UPI001FEE75C3|nr:restriction endonuclease subunit S [Wohlfahrtiimonas chitiniclastica]